jgi:hypothetical protein
MSDELMNRLVAARPDVPHGLLEPDNALLEEILMTEAPTARRVVTPVRLASVAALAAVLVAIALVLPSRDEAPRAVDMRQIAATTAAALHSGRAHLTYASDNGHFVHDRADFTIEFSGDNRSTVGTIDPGDGRGSAFPFANKVIDGRFFLEDGTRWVEDTNEHVSGSDIFSVDPRTLVAGATNAEFRDAGADTVDGVATRHLRATNLSSVPAMSLGFGPIGDADTKLTKFDVWVDADNVVRRLDLATSQTETVYPMAHTVVTKDAAGNVQKTLDQSNMGPAETRTTRNAYSVVFTDIGAPIAIVAPANATKVAGQG